ncbi:hypothetical protein NC653_013785 [Populus alba x Populus x berolinensis]|uniref:Uncharacterized protein n=1 Tax=Populus alba x Populus x berolinensis TaxID=444605 RepID=A0AAD6QVF5_9ROSI|nr:hypothetical protein NC653_013785 [Populus alba x Populus x berolinensis]
MSIASDLWHHQRQLEQRSDVEDRSLSTFSNAFDSSPTLKRDLWAVQSGQRCEQSQPLRIAQSTCRGFAAPRTEVLLWMILFQQLHDGWRELVLERDLIKPDRAQRQLMQNQNVTRQTRQLESELGGEDCPSTVDSRVSHSNMSIYGQDLMPIHPANFALMNPTPMG